MDKTIKITQTVAEETPSGPMADIATAPAAGQAYSKKAFLDGDIAPGGSLSFVLPLLFQAFGTVVRIFAEEAGKDLSDDYSVVLVTSGPQTFNLNPTPNEDGSIQLTIPARFGATGTEHLTSITVTDLDGLHADSVKCTCEAWA